jgi:flagellar protein FlbD
MIRVLRFNNEDLYLNPDHILSLEATPDTVLTLTNGEKFVLKDPVEEIIKRFIAYKQTIHQGPQTITK